MRVAFFCEGSQIYTPNREHLNARTDLAWAIALSSPIIGLQTDDNDIERYVNGNKFDWGICIMPKKTPDNYLNKLKRYCHRVAFMQEGPNWYYQDYSIDNQFKYLEFLMGVDLVLCHNKSDVNYYRGIVDVPVEVMPSLMIISDGLKSHARTFDSSKRSNAIIGGNFVSWYGGMDSYLVVASKFNDVFATSMGRKKEGEESIAGLHHIQYKNWMDWMYTLCEFKYGVHLMRTHAAGTFALNCAFWGIPCIGYYGLDTQEICHPELTVKIGDVYGARKKLDMLVKDSIFYAHCSEYAKWMCAEEYSESVWLDKMKNILS